MARVVRCSSRPYGCNVIYCRENGYFTKDEFDGPEWQFGRDYFELQKLYASVESGEVLDKPRLLELIRNYCGLMHRAAYLRASYNSAMDVLEGRAEFRDPG